AFVVGDQVMMKTRAIATPDTAIPMRSFFVQGIVEALRNDTPLKGKILVCIKRSSFIGTPAHGAMIDDYIFAVPAPDGIAFYLFFISQSESEKANDYVIGPDKYRVIFKGDTITR